MKAKFYLIIASLFISFIVSSQSNQPDPSLSNAHSYNSSSRQLPEIATDNWLSDASSWIRQFEYSFHASDGNAYRTISPNNKLSFLIKPDGYTASPMRLDNTEADWQVGFRLRSVGKGADAFYFDNPHTIDNAGNVLTQHFGFANVEYRNDAAGLRQNFIVFQNPATQGLLNVTLSLETRLSAKLVNQQSLQLYDKSGDKKTKLIYEDLKVWDANHQPLNAYMQLDKKGRELSLVVDDKDAVYPITIDPLNQTPDWTTSADGLIPGFLTNLQLQVQTLYGYTVTGLGDVNGDGFDDVAVSAPTMANVISGSGSLLGVGAVFVYYGAAGGLAAQPDHVLQPTATIGGGLFGLSVSAGDVVGTAGNFQPDIIVGAPLESITLNFGALGGGIVSGRVGRVYLFDAQVLSGTGTLNMAPTLSVSLSTSDLTNITITLNALLGFSVAATGDMNGDGRGEIIAGAPTFARVSGLANVKTGGAFVYLSGGFTTQISLDPPTGSLLGLGGAIQSIVTALPGGTTLWAVAGPLITPLVNGQIEGLLFGYSVENAGPYTSDAISDVIVGAPAGLNLSNLIGSLVLDGSVSSALSGQVVGGSAYIFPGLGNATGVNATAVARLQASPTGLLSNAANLFGYSMRGVKSITGVRNGNVLVGAPVSSVLSNVVGGLQLKAGTISVFQKQTGAITSPVLPVQTINSPRQSAILSILNGQVLNTSLLFGASMDNLLDVNCDNNADIIVGEPLSTNVPLIGSNVVGGSAYILLGKPDGTYTPWFAWNLTSVTSPLLGVNATALLGFSVAGGGYTRGTSLPVRAIVGGPANSLDFGVGLLNLGNTVGTLLGFAADNNGIGKAYSFNADLCGVVTLPATLISFKGERINNSAVGLEWTSVDEKDLSRYEVERSTDGTQFASIGSVQAKDLQRVTYPFTDGSPAFGNNYYRLKVVDDNGKFVYSNTIVVQFNQANPGLMAAVPNPAYQQISIRLSGYQKGEYTLRLYNTAGILFETRKINLRDHQQTEVMNRNRNMVPGVYMVTLHDENNNKLSTVRLVFNEQ
jgi:hypothetical protein